MINIYQSNKVNVLINFILKIKQKNPFEKNIIIIQNKDIIEWIQIKIAKKIGISANFSFQYPMEFLINLFCNEKKNPLNTKKNLTETQISWFILKIILNSLKEKELKTLKQYIGKKNKIEKINQLSEHISKLFKKYLKYKPEWINIWEENKIIKTLDDNQQWQKKIWIYLIKEIKKNKLNKFFIPKILKKIKKKSNLKKIFYKKKLPQKIIIYGINYLPVFYFKIINKIQKYIDVHIIHLNLLKNSKLNYKKKVVQKKNNYEINIKKELFKKIIKKNIFSLSKLKKINKKISLFENFKQHSLLNNIQQDILDLEKNNFEKKIPINSLNKKKINKYDTSLTFHSCHTKQIEIEVLYDYLLDLFKKNKKITPKDIVVMAPNINIYTSYIKGIFGSIPKKNRLPFKISDQNLITNNLILKTFIKLINIKKKKITIEKIFELLETPELSVKFCIKKNQINLLKKWIYESGISFNKKYYNRLKKNKYTKYNTLSINIDKIILGHIMKNKYEIWNNILPYNNHEILSLKLIKKFFTFVRLIEKWNEVLNKKKKIKDWIPLCKKLLKKFFCFDKKNQSVLNFIIQKWTEILNEGKKTKIKKKIPISIIYNKIKICFKKKNINKNFFSDHINFCNINKNRNIPYKVICLIGIKEIFHPNKDLEFDLIKKKNINMKYYDQYFLLENIILASNFLYISYIKNNTCNNYKKYPSIIIEEIINYINNRFYIKKNNLSNKKKNSKDIEKHIIKRHEYTFLEKNIFYLKKNEKYYTKKEKQKKEKSFCTTPIKSKKNKKIIKLKELLYFYKNPIKNFFNKKLKINFSVENTKIKKKEPFELNNLDKYKFNKIIIKLIIKRKNKKQITKILMSTGLFPMKNFGKIYIEKQIKNITPLIKKIEKYKKNKFNKFFSIKFNKNTIEGKLININNNGIIRYKPNILTIYDGFSLWIEHLIFCLHFNSCTSYYFGIKDSEWCFKKVELKEAQKYLKKIIIGYKKGMNFPLFFFQKNGWEWLNYFYDKKKKIFDFKSKEKIEKSKIKLIQSLKKTFNQQKEINNIYNVRIFNNFNKKLIKKIQKNTIKYILPMIKFAKYKKIKK